MICATADGDAMLFGNAGVGIGAATIGVVVSST
jgi:hypothetical protein